MDRFIGKRLDGRYEIHELIGVGGMAYVYKAYDRVEGRWVAIKILKEEFSNNSDFLRRFRNESKAIAVLNHPNIVKVYDVSFGDQIQYIVMEFIDGITLKEYIEQEGTIRWQEAVHFTTQILMALECAHEKGIIHRDIKPQNIMLLQDGSIKVADFGIARFLQSETQTMTDKAIGSVHYIAPEQASGDYITDKADIYSVGVMLYEMLTGKLPFVADNAVSVALMQLQAKPVMPRELNPSIPRGLEQITMRAMEKNPVDRFQSAGEMLDDLDEFRRNPNIVFHYDLQTANARYDASRSMEAYDASRQAPAYNDDYEYEEELVRSRRSAKGAMVVKGVLAAAMALSLLYALLPKGAVRGAARATGGLILLLVVLGPLAGLDLSDLTLRYQDLSRDMERQAEAYRQEGQAQLELGIQQRTAAYISEKAAQLGLSCRPRVETAWRDGVPYPSGVTLDIAENQALAEVLTDELGIPPSQQHWLG